MSNKAKSTDLVQAKSGFGELPKVGFTMKQRSPEKKENALPKEFLLKNPHSRIEVADGEQGNARNKEVESLQDISESLMATLWESINGRLHISKCKKKRSGASTKKNPTTQILSSHPHKEADTVPSSTFISSTITTPETFSTNQESTPLNNINQDANYDLPQTPADETQSAMKIVYNGGEIANSTHSHVGRGMDETSMTIEGESVVMDPASVEQEPDHIDKEIMRTEEKSMLGEV